MIALIASLALSAAILALALWLARHPDAQPVGDRADRDNLVNAAMLAVLAVIITMAAAVAHARGTRNTAGNFGLERPTALHSYR